VFWKILEIKAIKIYNKKWKGIPFKKLNLHMILRTLHWP